jgi:hypothetical protein
MVEASRKRSAPFERVSNVMAVPEDPPEALVLAESTLGQSAAEIERRTRSTPSPFLWFAVATVAAAGVIVVLAVGGGGGRGDRSAPSAGPATPAAPGASAPPARAPAPAAAAAPGAAAAPATYRVAFKVEPATAEIELDGARAGEGALERDLPRNGSEHALVVRAPGFEDFRLTFSETALPPATIALRRTADWKGRVKNLKTGEERKPSRAAAVLKKLAPAPEAPGAAPKPSPRTGANDSPILPP